jgi:glycosyltransferase involved in cell wall biosynthesis
MISFVIPLYNEQGNFEALVDSIIELRKKNKWDCEIVLVNDNSSDKTPLIADAYSKKYKFVTVVHRKKGNNGMGFSLIEGTKKAKGDIIIWTMGDKSDDIATYKKLVEKIKAGYDIVFAARYIKGGSRGNLGKMKAFFSSGYSKLAGIVYGMKVHDITNAFRAFRKEVFEKCSLESGDFAISPEFAIKAHLKGYKLGEVPTTYTNRVKGESKFKLFKMGARYISLFRIH